MIALASYLLKLIICSGIFFLYYHIALRNKLFHQWNRFYLLTSVLLSLTVPVVQVAITHQITDQSGKVIQLLKIAESANDYLEEVVVYNHKPISTDQWILAGYILISIVLLCSLIFSLLRIFAIIRKSAARLINNIKFIITNARGTPFSFFHFIFWNNEIDLQSEAGRQIFEHELVHVREKHSLDKIFMEIILAMFWCNPFFWLIRKELKIIHEFIADKKAIGQHDAKAFAAMILQSAYPQQFTSIANHFFQTSIKRRLSMLIKIQKPGLSYLSRILVLPVLAFLIFAFTIKTKIISTPSVHLEKPITVVIDAGHGITNGNYTGARWGNAYEDDIALSIAEKIKELNTNDKLNIVLTRTSEDNIDLHKRVDIAKESNADLFISIHANARTENQDPKSYAKDSKDNGFEIYISNKQPSYQYQSEVLGSVLQQELNSVYPTNPVLLKRQTGVWVLDQNVCPSVLVECGYLTNQKDKDFITNEGNQKAVAEKILEAIERYESNNNSILNNSDSVPQNDTAMLVTENYKGNKYKAVRINGAIQELWINDKAVPKNEFSKYEPVFDEIKTFLLQKREKAIHETEQKISNPVETFPKNTSNDVSVKFDGHFPSNSTESPLFFVNGKEATKKQVYKIDPSTIASVNILKNSTAINKYGDKAKNGAVEIFLKINKSTEKTILKNEGDPIGKGTFKVNTIKNQILFKGTINPGWLSKDTIPKTEPLFNKVEKEASVDKAEWQNFLIENLQPVIRDVSKKAPPGKYTVYVRFIVKKDGSISDITAIKNPGYSIAEKVETMMKNSPKWSPALQNGQAVSSYHTQPITLVITK